MLIIKWIFFIVLIAHKPLAHFLETTKLMTPEQRAEHLKHSFDIATINDNVAEEGDSNVR